MEGEQQGGYQQHDAHHEQTVSEHTLDGILEEDTHDTYGYHREEYLGYILCLGVPAETEHAGKESGNFAPQHHQRTAHRSGVYQHGKGEIVAALNAQQVIGNFEVPAATHGQIFGETLYESQPQSVEPSHSFSELCFFSGSL